MADLCIHRRQWLAATTASAVAASLPSFAQADAAAWTALKAPGAIALFRHALAPGVGDPPGFKLGDCRTQRNLSEEGKSQAQRMGRLLRERSIKVQAVWYSEWCRARDTAELAFADLPEKAFRAEPAFNSFFADRSTAAAQTAAARKLLLAWQGTGALMVVTHQVNITQLTDVVPQSGEAVVLQRQGQKLLVKGTIQI